ncbi:hypothetical protein B4064_1806 [Caldibacillus thermoamylovorans]|nr:hypothetical protein B4065_2049 [Caldibacillus thermoamylovorans]KIO68013.1 hypothetical protein B4064_1806 [Caldibacillus thermoamylovorans]
MKPPVMIAAHFNPRTHEECDEKGADYFVIAGISIHAPMKSAT